MIFYELFFSENKAFIKEKQAKNKKLVNIHNSCNFLVTLSHTPRPFPEEFHVLFEWPLITKAIRRASIVMFWLFYL